MATEREFHETTARCVSIMVYFQNERRTELTRAAMTGEVHVIADWILKLGLSAGELDRRLFKAVEEELVARYGRPTGSRLSTEFVGAFESVDAVTRPARLVGNTIRV